MDIKKITIKNINKKIIAATMAFSLATCAATGCVKINNINIEKPKQEEFAGIIGFGLLKDCYFIGVKNPGEKEKFYIAQRVESTNSDFHLYMDLISGQNVYINRETLGFNMSANKKLTREVKIDNYLYDFNMIKKVYSEEDIKELLQKMQQSNVNETIKK